MSVNKDRNHAVGVLAMHAVMRIKKDSAKPGRRVEDVIGEVLDQCRYDIGGQVTGMIQTALEESMDVENSECLMTKSFKEMMDNQAKQLAR